MRIGTTTLTLAALVTLPQLLSAQATRERSTEQKRDVERTFSYSRVPGEQGDRPQLGINTSTTGVADTLGVLVAGVTADGPAEKAGIAKGDRLASVNGVSLRLAADDASDEALTGLAIRRLVRALEQLKAGDEVELRVLRDGSARVAKVKTVAASDMPGYRRSPMAAVRARLDRATLGVNLGSPGSARDTLGIPVTGLASDGPAEKAGVEEGDRIAAINGVDLRVAALDAGDRAASRARLSRLNRELENVKAGESVTLRLYRGGQLREVKVTTVAARDLAGDFGGMLGGMLDGLLDAHYFEFATPPIPPRPLSTPRSPSAPRAPQPPTALLSPRTPMAPMAPMTPIAPPAFQQRCLVAGFSYVFSYRSAPRVAGAVVQADSTDEPSVRIYTRTEAPRIVMRRSVESRDANDERTEDSARRPDASESYRCNIAL
ncbi:MAG: PDZ domain-containing protein [Gemmatimonadaceae bacterium]